MWELLIEPAKKFIEGGIDAFVKSKDYQNLSLAVQDRLRREVRLNNSLLEAIEEVEPNTTTPRHADSVKIELLRSVQTNAFDDTTGGGLPLSIFFSSDISPDWFPKNTKEWPKRDQYLKNIRTIKKQHELVERIYHRLKIARTFALAGKLNGDLHYLRFLLIGAERSIAEANVSENMSPADKKKWYEIW